MRARARDQVVSLLRAIPVVVTHGAVASLPFEGDWYWFTLLSSCHDERVSPVVPRKAAHGAGGPLAAGTKGNKRD
jgi:hypothetical protein